METADQPIASSPAADWLPRDATFTPAEIPRLFEADSPLLRRNPYALSAPPNTQRARRADWNVFATFCKDRQYLALPASPAVVAAFIEAMSTPTATRPARAVASLERYVSTIAHAHALAELPDPTRTAYEALSAKPKGQQRRHGDSGDTHKCLSHPRHKACLFATHVN